MKVYVSMNSGKLGGHFSILLRFDWHFFACEQLFLVTFHFFGLFLLFFFSAKLGGHFFSHGQ